MWHASVAKRGADALRLSALARSALDGVGDPKLGEWKEWTGRAFHLRRRLTDAEAQAVGHVRDIRGTAEAAQRLDSVRPWLPAGWVE